MPECVALDVVSTRREEVAPQLAPAFGIANINQLADARRPERQHRLRRVAIELREKSKRGNSRKFTDQGSDAGAGCLVTPRHRDYDRADAVRLEILDELRDRVPMQRSIGTFTRGVDANALVRREQQGVGQRAQEYGFRIGLALVLTLMVFATWNDLVNIGIVKFFVGLVS